MNKKQLIHKAQLGWLTNKIKYINSYTKAKLNPGEGEFKDLSNENVAYITPNTRNISSILTNDFVEDKNNNFRQAKDFKQTNDTLIGDKNIPLSSFNIYYGIDNGKLKAGPLNTFNDTTYIMPNRSPFIGKIKEIIPPDENAIQNAKQIEDDYYNAIDKHYNDSNKEIKEYNNKMGYKAPLIDRIYGQDPTRTLYKNANTTEAITINHIASSKYPYPEFPQEIILHPRYITENNDTIKDYNINATPKTLFADEYGNAAFASNIEKHMTQINDFLRKHPSYPLMVDNGRYSFYQGLNNGNEVNYKSYIGFSDTNKIHPIGTIKP